MTNRKMVGSTRPVRRRCSSTRWQQEAGVALLLVALLTSGSHASIAMETDVDVELFKVAKSPPPVLAPAPTAAATAAQGVANSSMLDSAVSRPTDQLDQLLAAEAANGPPVYRSAPKQIESSPNESGQSWPSGGQQQAGGQSVALAGREQAHDLVRRQELSSGPEDLSTAAGHHKKKKHKKKKKIIIVKKKKKKKKKRKKKKKIIVVKKKKKKKHHKKVHHHHHKKHHHKKKKKKKKVIYYKPKHSLRVESKHPHSESGGHGQDEPDEGYHHEAEEQRQHNHHHHNHNHHHHHEPEANQHHGHHASASMGKYYDYRSVPKKGAWEFGFRRGNEKHLIERKEHGHKSHFKTIFNWKDKKGKGKHLFDYNHGDYHKKHYGAAAAAASQAPVKQLVPLASATKIS